MASIDATETSEKMEIFKYLFPEVEILLSAFWVLLLNEEISV